MFLALLASGCTKEKADRISIFANNMNGNSKVWVNPASPNGATWVAGETINLNGSEYTITANAGGSFSLNVEPLAETMYAVYPATMTEDGNDIAVTNSNASGATITLKSLAVNFLSTGGHTVIFPMAEKAAANSGSLYFDHLTAGLRLTLANSSASGIAVDHIKLVVQGTEAASSVTRDGVSYTVQWAVQGPTTPSGNIGGISGDQEVKFSSEMNLQMQNSGAAGVTVPASGSIQFCVPATVATVKHLSVTGYDANGNQLFTKNKSLASNATLEVNHIYDIPSFNIN